MSKDNQAIEPTAVKTGAEVAATKGTNLPASASGNEPAWTWGGAISGIINFITLGARVMALAVAAALLKEHLHLLKNRMHADASRARRLAGHLAQAGVDPQFQAQAFEVAASFERVAEASGEVAGAADHMESNAQDVKDAHDAEYGGIHEVANSSAYAQPKPGFNEVR